MSGKKLERCSDQDAAQLKEKEGRGTAAAVSGCREGEGRRGERHQQDETVVRSCCSCMYNGGTKSGLAEGMGDVVAIGHSLGCPLCQEPRKSWA